MSGGAGDASAPSCLAGKGRDEGTAPSRLAERADDYFSGTRKRPTWLAVPDTIPPPDRALDRTGMFAVAIGVLLLLLIGAASVWLASRAADASRANERMQTSRSTATEALLSLERAETGQRGYLLTGNTQYLDVYNLAVRQVPADLTALGAMARSAQHVPRMLALARAKLAEMARTIELYDAGRSEQALELVRTNVGQNVMEEYRRLSDEIVAADEAELSRMLDRTNADTRLLVGVDAAGVLVVLALAGLLAAGVNRALRLLRQARARLAAANDKLERSNDTLEDAVRQRTADLTLANDEIQRFAYIVSHDLRSPLVNIMGFTSELEIAQRVLEGHVAADAPPEIRAALHDELPEAIRFIRTSTAKMDRLIGAILRLSREGRRRLLPEALDMTALLQGIADTMAHQTQQFGASIDVGTIPPITADRVSVEQVFGNVCENALKYLQPGRPGQIHIRGEAVGTMIRFEVEDNGRGIATRDLDRVFDLFRRAGDQTVPGEGIGLAHVRALVRRLGGTISCRSELGVGSVFTIDLPVRAVQQTETDG